MQVQSYPAVEQRFEHTMLYRVTCAALLLWWLGFLYPQTAFNDTVGNLMNASESTEQGSLYNQFVIFAFAAIGLFYWPSTFRVLRAPQGRKLILLLLLYCAWCGASLLWSEDASLTIRRFTAFLLMLVGCWGLGAGFYARTRSGVLIFARHALWASVIAVLLLFAKMIANGRVLDLLNPQWSMKYSTQTEMYAFPVGYGTLAMLVVLHTSAIKRWLAIGVFFSILLLLKGRTMITDVLAAGAIVYSRITALAFMRAFALFFGYLLTAVLVDLGTGGAIMIALFTSIYDSVAAWIPYLTIGDGIRNITTLSGRIVLWRMVYRYIEESPYIGHGFGAFWGPDRFSEAFAQTKWHAVVAHNGYLDELLATGAVGLVLFLGFWLYGMFISFRAGRIFQMATGFMVFGWLLLFLMFNTMVSINQSYFTFPTVASLIGLFALLEEYACDRCPDCNRKVPHAESYEGEL